MPVLAKTATADRRHVRVRVDFCATPIIDGCRYCARVHDISVGGLYLTMGVSLPVGQELLIELVLPGQAEPLLAPGRIVRDERRVEQWGMGLQFADLEPQQRACLELLVARWSERQLGL